MKSLLKPISKSLYASQKKILIYLSTILIKSIKPNIILAYDANAVRDGAGAQLHRILSLSLVSTLFNFRMAQPIIEDITIHPLDPIQDSISLKSYLQVWNERLFNSKEYFQQTNKLLSNRNRYLDSINLRSIILLSIKSKFSKVPMVIHTKESHSISDYCVEKYRDAIRTYFLEFLCYINSQRNDSELIIHYRQGSGGFVIYPGQSIPRQMPIDSVISAVENISSSSMAKLKVMRLFTDSPKESFSYFPIESQLHLWKDMPGFDGKTISNESSGIEERLLPMAKRKQLFLVVDRKVDAFQMIVEMARSEALIISRSSLSYVGALFNFGGEVFYPTGFWHTKLKEWRTYK